MSVVTWVFHISFIFTYSSMREWCIWMYIWCIYFIWFFTIGRWCGYQFNCLWYHVPSVCNGTRSYYYTIKYTVYEHIIPSNYMREPLFIIQKWTMSGMTTKTTLRHYFIWLMLIVKVLSLAGQPCGIYDVIV